MLGVGVTVGATSAEFTVTVSVLEETTLLAESFTVTEIVNEVAVKSAVVAA